MIKFYNITEDSLTSKPFTSEALYICSDTGNMYLDSPLEGARVRISSEVIYLSNETERKNLLAPIPKKIYCVLGSGMYIYINGKWNHISSSSFMIPNVLVTGGTASISDDRILNGDYATFIPDLSVADLVSDVTCTCTDGTVTITLTSNYDIPGMILVS